MYPRDTLVGGHPKDEHHHIRRMDLDLIVLFPRIGKAVAIAVMLGANRDSMRLTYCGIIAILVLRSLRPIFEMSMLEDLSFKILEIRNQLTRL
jgi:hypothetical protein